MSIEGSSANPVGTASPLLKERYELGERLTEGTFFYTYRGRDLETGRQVAIKVLKADFASDEAFSGRLLSEAVSAVGLHHANVAQVYEAWRERGTVVIVAEWVRGINLKDRIRRVAPFPLAVAMDIVHACAEALNHAHESGYVHGDVRPDNIIITPDGRVKLTDFGIGASAAASSRIQLSTLEQAAYYLAPELAEGRPPDARTDIYSLGCLLYEMLTGVPPYDADTPLAVAIRHIQAPVPSIKQINPSVPNAVDGIAQKCMQKDAMARYITVQGLVQDIREVQDALRNDRSLTWSPLKAAESAPVAEKPKPRRAPVETPAPEPKPRPVNRRVAEEPPVRTDSGPSMTILAGMALVGLLMIVSFFGAVRYFTDKPSEVLVPSVVGKTQAAAAAELEKYRLKAEVQEDFNDRQPPGTVFKTFPSSGMEMLTGKAVVLYVSKGPQPVSVPDVVGQSIGSAQAVIRGVSLVVGTTTEEFSEVTAKGQVIAQTPTAGTQVKKKSSVNLIVSKGREPVPEPENVQINSDEPEDGGDGDTSTDGDTDGDTRSQEQQHRVTIQIPERATGPQKVEIKVRNEDGSEETAYEQEHQPGESFTETVTTFGRRGKSRIRVYVNGRLTPAAD